MNARKYLSLWLTLPFFLAYCSSSQKKVFTSPADDMVDAAERGDEKRVAEFIAQKQDVNQKNQNSYTPLMSAAERGNLAVVNQLIAAGAKVNTLNNFSWNALMLACVGGHTEVVKAHYSPR